MPKVARLYLPLSEDILDRVLGKDQGLEAALACLEVPQLAALLVVHALGGERPVPVPGRMLAELIELGNRWNREQGRAAFMAQVLAALTRDTLRRGRERLAQEGIELLTREELAHRTYLTAEGEWESGFTRRHREQQQSTLKHLTLPRLHTLTPEQGQVFREVEADSDEHLHVQGYAGIGKSFLITSLLSLLVGRGAVIALLAERRRQLEALLARVGHVEGVHPLTFGELMDEVIPQDLTDPSYKRMKQKDRSQAILSDERLVQQLGIHASGDLSAIRIARLVRGVVGAFCRSDAPEIGPRHIPLDAPTLDATTRQVVLYHAAELWKAIVMPTTDFRPPVRDYHRIKWAALQGWRIPDHYTHVVMDECHDLPPALIQLVEGSPQAVISLGDEYQNLQARPHYRSPGIRLRELHNSVRSGELIEDIVNPIIQMHPGRTKEPFQGSPQVRMEVVYYDKAEVPAEPALVLVEDDWGLFEWAQRLADKGAFALLADLTKLDMFVSDCIELHRHGIRSRHHALFRHASWEEVARRHGEDPGFRRIDRMLERGYALKDWARTRERISPTSSYGLGLIEDVRNREFDCVMLAPDVVEAAWRTRHNARAEAGSAIYVAVTRARRRLYLPRRLKAWIEELETV